MAVSHTEEVRGTVNLGAHLGTFWKLGKATLEALRSGEEAWREISADRKPASRPKGRTPRHLPLRLARTAVPSPWDPRCWAMQDTGPADLSNAPQLLGASRGRKTGVVLGSGLVSISWLDILTGQSAAHAPVPPQ